MVHEVSTRRCGHEAHILSCFNKSGSRHLPLPSPLRLWFYLYAFPFSRLFWIMLLCWQICIRALFSNLLVWLSMCYIFYLFAFILLPTLLCWAYFNKVWPTEFDDSLQTFSHGTWIRDKVIRLPMKQIWKSAEQEHTDNPHESIVLISWTWCTHFFCIHMCARSHVGYMCVIHIGNDSGIRLHSLWMRSDTSPLHNERNHTMKCGNLQCASHLVWCRR